MNTEKVHLVFDCPVSPWIIGGAALALLIVVLAFTARDSARLRRRVRAAILTLIAVAVALLAGLLLSPKIIRTWTDARKPSLTVLVDDSRSMSLTDRYDGAAAAWINPRLAENERAPRPDVGRDRVTQMLLSTRPERWLNRVQQDFNVVGCRFAGSVGDLALGEDAPPFAVDPEGYSTALGDALQAVAGDSRSDRPRAVVIISDGAWNTGRDPAAIARVLARMGVPVYAVGVGNPDPPRDAAVLDLRGPRNALLGDELLLAARVSTTGMGAARVTVQLLRDGEPVAEKQAVTLPSGRPVDVSFSYVPQQPGRRRFTARIARQPGEQDESNNAAETFVTVTERKIRLLLIDNEPRWEFRFMRNVFERDPSVEQHICLLRPGVGAIAGEGFVSALPIDKKALAQYDLVILGDVPRASLPDKFLAETADAVRQRGLALIVIAGRRGRYVQLADTPLAAILPVTLPQTGVMLRGGPPFTAELTPDGATHLVTRLAPTADENDDTWMHLPPLHWAAEVDGLKRGAAALLVHPLRLAGAGKLPLLAVQKVGAGKVMFAGAEETWRWRREVGDKYHYRFWAQTVRWLTRRQFAEGDTRARLSADRTECDVGETVEVEAFCLGEDGFPLDNATVTLAVTGPDGAVGHMAMRPAPGSWGLYRAELRPPRAGEFTLRPIVSAYGNEPLPSTLKIAVTRPDLEKTFLAQDRAGLSALAQAGGGRYLGVGDVDQLPELLHPRAERRTLTAEHALCRNWYWYGALAATLALAWFIRKRSGLA